MEIDLFIEDHERQAWIAFFGMAISKIAVFPGLDAIKSAGAFADKCMPYYRARFALSNSDVGFKPLADVPAEIAAQIDAIEKGS
jgi:hypothetical protein